MKKILIIAYDYPPILSAESIQVQRRVIMLSHSNKVYVVTSHLFPFLEISDEELIELNKNITVFRTKRPFLERGLNYFYKALCIVDRKLWWNDLGYEKAKEIIEKEGVDILCSDSTPFTSHIVALRLKKRFDLPWIAHFSDPWSFNPYIRYPTKFQRYINKAIEGNIIKSADKITVPSQKMKELFLKKYQRDIKDIHIVPHFFDSRVYEFKYEKKRKDRNFKTIVHTGNIYGKRTISFLLRAIKDLNLNLKFEFYGKVKESDISLLKELKLDSKVRLYGQLRYREAIKKICEADLLLLVEAPLPGSPFFPSKLVDYIGAKKPIIALSPRNSETRRILKDIGNDNFIASPDNLEEIKELLHKIEKAIEKPLVCNEEAINKYDMKNTAIFEKIFDI